MRRRNPPEGAADPTPTSPWASSSTAATICWRSAPQPDFSACSIYAIMAKLKFFRFGRSFAIAT